MPTTIVPEDLTPLDDEQLAALLAEREAEFDHHHDHDGDVPTLTALADRIEAMRREQTGRGTAGRLALRERVHPPTTPVSAFSMRRPNLAAVASIAPQPRPPAGRATLTITAAFDNTVRWDLAQVGQAMHDTARNLRDGDKRARIAAIEVPYPTSLQLGSDPARNIQVLDDLVGHPSDAAALVAAGGWCAPSEPLFELFDIGPDADGLLDLPGVRARAGVMIPAFVGFGDVAGALWTWTEADDIAAVDNDGSPTDTTKPCLFVPCPTWTECRLEAEGLCVTAGNLSDRAFPELSRQFLHVVMNAHLHRVSASKIASIVADSVAVVPNASMINSDAAGDLLGVLALATADLRSQYRLGRRRAFDVVLPEWIVDVLRANVAKRAGDLDMLSVTDDQVVGWLTNRGIRPQFVSDWQPLFAGPAATAQWPDTVQFLVYPSGSYIELDGGRIDLGVQRDSTLNTTNDFTLGWSEQFFQVCRRGPQARRYTMPLHIDGVTACCPAA